MTIPVGAPLPTFDDRYTMRYERTYPHPIERVFEAVSTTEHLDAWLLPPNRVDPCPGGAFGMSFGGETFEEGTVAEYDPPRVIDYEFENGSRLRFELESVSDGTRTLLLHSWGPGDFGLGHDAIRRDEHGNLKEGSELPAGPDTPWRPDFVAGWYMLLFGLGDHLDGHPEPRDHAVTWESLLPVMHNLIAGTIPGGVR